MKPDVLLRMKPTRRRYGPMRQCAVCGIMDGSAGIEVFRFQLQHGAAVNGRRTSVSFGTLLLCDKCLRSLRVQRSLRDRAHCLHGHSWTAANTARSKDGYRRCRTCYALRQKGVLRFREALP